LAQAAPDPIGLGSRRLNMPLRAWWRLPALTPGKIPGFIGVRRPLRLASPKSTVTLTRLFS